MKRTVVIALFVVVWVCCLALPAFAASRVPDADSTENRLMPEAIGNKADTTVQVVSATSSQMRYLKGLLDGMSGASGIAAWAAGAAPANGVSMSEAIRYIAEQGAGGGSDQVLAEISGAAGITTWAAGAAPDDAVSISEGLRYATDALAGAIGLVAFPAAAVPANDVSMAEVLRSNYLLSAPAIATGEADIDISEVDYTSYQVLVTIIPAATAPLSDVQIVFDLAKATTGYAAGHTAETLIVAAARKIDGTNWRTDAEQLTTAISGTNAALTSITLPLGDVGVTEEVRIMVILSAENADTEIPFALSYRAIAAPTVTPVALP